MSPESKLSLSYIREKAEKFYRKKFLVQYLQTIPFENSEFEIPFGKIPTVYRELSELKKNITTLKENENPNTSYILAEETIHTRDSGEQTIPKKVYFDSAEALLHFLRKTKEAKKAKSNFEFIQTNLPELREFILTHLDLLIEIEERSNWVDIIKVCRYFLDSHIPNKFYLRELTIEVHSKFIEDNDVYLKKLLNAILPSEKINPDVNKFELRYFCLVPEEIIRIKFLDSSLKEKYNIPFTDFSIPLSEFSQLNFQSCNVLILENKTSFNLLQGDFYFSNTIALFGSGFAVLQYKEMDVDNIPKPIDWILNNKIFYWGDIDSAGFEILSKFRKIYPHTVSVFMDKSTFTAFEKFSHTIDSTKEDNPENLSAEELELYTYLKENNLRLEQERLTHAFIRSGLSKIL